MIGFMNKNDGIYKKNGNSIALLPQGFHEHSIEMEIRISYNDSFQRPY